MLTWEFLQHLKWFIEWFRTWAFLQHPKMHFRFFELERYVFSYTNETLVGMTELRKDPLYNTIYLVIN